MLYKEYFGEGKNIEFKREIPNRHEKFLKDVIAFSNSTGGKIFIGIEDRTNEVVGIGEQNPFKLADNISNMIFDSCSPIIDPEITVQTIEGKTVIVVEVFPGRMRPYYLKSIGKKQSSYIRINGTSRPADDRKLKELELEGQKISYDSLPEIDMEYSEKEAKELCDRMEQVAYKAQITQTVQLDSEQGTGESAVINKMSIEKLEDLGLLCRMGKELQPTHAFMLMTQNKMRYAKIQCGLFKGTERDIFIDKREFGGPLYIQAEEAYQFVLKHINLTAKIEGLFRKETYELPVRTIRELIANAVVHRSYLDDSCIQICIFDDRLEVTSPGMLYGGLDMQSVKSGKSKCRNTAIAEAFRYMGIIEAWGTGIPRMIKECREYGLKEPLFEELGDSIRVTLFRKNKEETIMYVHDKTVTYDEGNHCLNTEKSLFDIENHCLNTKKPLFDAVNHCLNTEKQMFDTENRCLNTEKSMFDTGNRCLKMEKPLIQNGKQVKSTCSEQIMLNVGETSLLYRRLEELQDTRKVSNVTALNIKAIIETFSDQEVFGRKEIKERIGYKDSKAGFLIEKMQEFELIEKVKGKGKGKYCFSK